MEFKEEKEFNKGMEFLKKTEDEFLNFIEEFKKYNPEFDLLEERQNRLRDLRNKLTSEYGRINGLIQREIDRIDLNKFKVDELVGKYIKVHNRDDWNIMYMKVNEIHRLYSGPKLVGPTFVIYTIDDVSEVSIYDSFELSVRYENLNKIEIISKDEFYTVLDKNRIDLLKKFEIDIVKNFEG